MVGRFSFASDDGLYCHQDSLALIASTITWSSGIKGEVNVSVADFMWKYVIVMNKSVWQVSKEAEGEAEDETAQTGLDEFTRKLSEDDARVLVDLLKLAVAGRAGSRAVPAITKVLGGQWKE